MPGPGNSPAPVSFSSLPARAGQGVASSTRHSHLRTGGPASARASAHVRRMRAGGRSSAVCVYRGGNGRGTGAQKAKPLHPVDAGALRCKSLTMTYFHRRMPTIIGAKAFHDPVRDGKAWDHLAMVVKRNGLPEGRLLGRPGQSGEEAHTLQVIRADDGGECFDKRFVIGCTHQPTKAWRTDFDHICVYGT